MKELGEESQFGLGSDEEGEQESEEEVEERGGGQEGEKLVSLSEVLDNVVVSRVLALSFSLRSPSTTADHLIEWW